MASGDGAASSRPGHGTKKRRLQGACDICRDSAKMPGNKCTHCISFNSECTHFLSKVPDDSAGEAECVTLTRGDAYHPFQEADASTLVAAILDDTDVFFATTPPASHKGIIIRLAKLLRALQDAPRPTEEASDDDDDFTLPPLEPNTEASPPASDEINITNVEVATLAHGLRDMVLNAGFERVYGPASTVGFIKCALDIRAACATEEDGEPDMQRRMEFWSARPWELTLCDDRVPLQFPDPSLMADLVDLYFRTYNCYVVLLHRPTIECGIADGMHVRHYGFGSLLLMICACASKLSDDPRVLADRRPGAQNSAGWQWYSQIRFVRRTYPLGPDLYELQAAALAVLYAHGISSCDDTYYIHAVAIRLAQEIGAHKRRGTTDRIQDELYKRLYWVLVVEDIHLVSIMGRPRATGDEDINLEPYIEVDDEYWSTFTQPAGQTPGPMYMNAFIRGVHILGVLNQTIYACRRPKMPAGMTVEAWETRVIGCIDTVVNKWLCTLPSHLRWDPTQPNPIYRDQAAGLIALMSYIQIQAHRSGIPSTNATRSMASLSTCAQCARNCLRQGFIPWPHVQQAVFCSTASLMLYVWRTRERGKECEADVADINKGIALLQSYERRFGNLRDVIYNLFPRGGFTFDHNGSFSRVEKRKQTAPDDSVASSGSSIATPLSHADIAHAVLPDEPVHPPFSYAPGVAEAPVYAQEEQQRLDEIFQQHVWPSLPTKQNLMYAADNTNTQVQRPLFDFDLDDGVTDWGAGGMIGGAVFATGASGLPVQSDHRPSAHRPYYQYNMAPADVLPEAVPLPTQPLRRDMQDGNPYTHNTGWYHGTY
ncbi:hypothetical protein BD626DRAFT_497814 [Schizophyllum amplum]|uniref:Xylanolytic transcriptional activator regulatory domain-containing protein n=1 Tax=Schizophyllum amplum TaxID=97359 RepID=A0A550CCQ8_9AGAR|nr:hypothetical protein BD626DRAFT_497814 [Auriculariopsis ampla]